MTDLDALLKSRGVQQNLGAHVTSCSFDRAGSMAAFALGDGSVHFSDGGQGWSRIQAHDGAVLSFAQDLSPFGFISGGDDGKFNRVTPEAVTPIADFGMKWVDHAVSFAHPKNGLLACSVGKNLHLFDSKDVKLRSFAHPSTVTGIAFDAKGKRIAASHYNGASLWFTSSSSANPRLLEWKGSHIGIALHPEGEALVTAMQENSLHGWTLPEGKHMRMSGYPAKTESFGFTRSGKWLSTAGADAIVIWPFFGGGPMGKAPLEMAGGDGTIVRTVACHPQHEVVAAGFDDGLVIMADIAREKILPVAAPGRGTVSAMAWNASGSHLAFGTADGFAAIVDFSLKA